MSQESVRSQTVVKRIGLSWIGSVSLAAVHLVFSASIANAATKQVTIRAVESTEDFKLVVYGRVLEVDNGVSFPVATIDREALSLELGKSFKMDLKPDSLTTFGSAAQSRARRMIVAMPFAVNVSPNVMRDFQQTLAENLPETRSDFFTVLSVTSAGVTTIASSIPGESDNMRALQRKVLDALPAGDAVAASELVCAAEEKFSDWARYPQRSGDQNVLIVMANPSVANRSQMKRLEACLANLKSAGVATFFLRAEKFPELTTDIEPIFSRGESRGESRGASLGGGYAQRVATKVDLYPALANILANLNEEYVLTFDLFPLVGTFDGRRAIAENGFSHLSLRATYHGQSYQSGLLAVPLPPGWQKNIDSVNQSQNTREKFQRLFAGMTRAERGAVGLLGLVLLVSIVFIMRHFLLVIRLNLKTLRCRTCGQRVKRSFRNCPYRAGTHIGWLSVLSGPGVGMVLPVVEGKNLVGTSNACSVLLAGAKKIKGEHAEITAENGKAQVRLLQAVRLRQWGDSVNGFPLMEPRLVSHGDVLHFGDVFLRFEVRQHETQMVDQ